MTKLDVRPQRARRRLDGARVSRKLRVEPCPTFRRRGLCDECASRAAEPRPSSRVPSAPSLSVSRLGDTHSTRTVLLTRTCRAPATVALSSKSRRAFFAASCTVARAMGRRPASCRSRRSAISSSWLRPPCTRSSGAPRRRCRLAASARGGATFTVAVARVTLAAVTSTGGRRASGNVRKEETWGGGVRG